MAWSEGRTATLSAPNDVAHDDASKERTSESTLNAPRRSAWPVLALAVLVLVGAGVAAVAMTNDDPATSPVPPSGPSADPTRSVPTGSTSDPSPTGSASPGAGSPAGGQLFRGRVLSIGDRGETVRFAMTARVVCEGSCTLTVVKAPDGDGELASIFAEHTFAPAGNGRYAVSFSSPVDRPPPGCEGLTRAGTTSLTLTATSLVVKGRHRGDSVNTCVMGAREFEYRGAPVNGG